MEEFKPSSCLERKISSKERRRGRRAAAAAKQFNYASVVKSVDSSENVNLKSESNIQNMELVSTENVVLETIPAGEANAENSSLGLYDIKVLVMDTTEKMVCDIDVQNENLKEKVEEISCTDNNVKIDNAIINRVKLIKMWLPLM